MIMLPPIQPRGGATIQLTARAVSVSSCGHSRPRLSGGPKLGNSAAWDNYMAPIA
jgi:hypothetical protein